MKYLTFVYDGVAEDLGDELNEWAEKGWKLHSVLQHPTRSPSVFLVIMYID